MLVRLGVWTWAACLIAALCLPAAAMAGDKPSTETCETMGALAIRCCDCSQGKYLGKVALIRPGTSA